MSFVDHKDNPAGDSQEHSVNIAPIDLGYNTTRPNHNTGNQDKNQTACNPVGNVPDHDEDMYEKSGAM